MLFAHAWIFLTATTAGRVLGDDLEEDGRSLTVPLAWFPRLRRALAELDEDLS